jgi:hypothetical protein
VRFPKCSTPLSYGLGDMEVLNMTGNGGGIFLDYGLRGCASRAKVLPASLWLGRVVADLEPRRHDKVEGPRLQ